MISHPLNLFILLSVLGLTGISPSAFGDDLAVLPPPSADGAIRGSLLHSLRQEAFRALDKRRAAFEQLKTPDDLRRWQEQRREFFLRQIGSFPERTPLNASATGTLQGEGYRIEKIIYESRPGHHITANLYLPSSPPPYPAVLVPCGHSFDGKASEQYQRASILLARNGMAALCYDPIGQGERLQTFSQGRPLRAVREGVANPAGNGKENPGRAAFTPVEEHTLAGIGSILVGRNAANFRVYDGMRSIDYLISRGDIDAKRIGVTGNSGGGTLTAYLMAIDDRIACGAPGCYPITFQRLLETQGPQDAEQNIFGQIAFGLDVTDYVLMTAPKPAVVLAGTRDVTFDIGGTWDLFRESKRFYGRWGYPERISLVEADAPHGFTVDLRIGAVRWMRRWLLGRDDAITESDLAVWKEKDLRCTPEGQVMLLPGEQSVFEFNRAEELRLAAARADDWKKRSRAEILQAVSETAGIRPLAKIPGMKSETLGRIQREGYQIEKRILENGDGLLLPALAFIPAQPARDTYLYLHGDGKQVDGNPGGAIEKLVRGGHMVLALDLPGIGEMAGNEPLAGKGRHWTRPLFGRGGEAFWLAYLLGKSLVGLRAESVLAAGRLLQSENGSDPARRRIHVIGIGRGGLPALHAGALEPDLFASLTLRRTLRSWADVVHAPLGNAHLAESVHGALRVYDMPDLVRVIGSGRAVIEEPLIPR